MNKSKLKVALERRNECLVSTTESTKNAHLLYCGYKANKAFLFKKVQILKI